MEHKLTLITDGIIKKTIKNISAAELSLSEYNPRSNREDDNIDLLAKRIGTNGFEVTRALWVYQNETGYKVFAGGTRLEAARRAGCKTIPCVIHEGLTDDDKVRLAYEDNENDEYHAEVGPVDVWANYAALSAAGWTQVRIAEAVGLGEEGRVMVSYRLNLHKLPDKIKGFVNQGLLKETHLLNTMTLSIDLHFQDWLTTEQAQFEVCNKAAVEKLNTRDTGKLASKYKAFIKLADDYYKQLPENLQSEFVSLLTEAAARDDKQVQKVIDAIDIKILKEKQEAEQEAMRIADAATAERLEAEDKAELARYRQQLDNIKQGDRWKLGKHILICGDGYNFREYDIPDIDSVITDPPYGKDYQPDWKKWNGEPGEFNAITGDDEKFNPAPFIDYPTVLFFGADYFSDLLPVGSWLCWDKRTDAKKDNMFGSPFELAWFKSNVTTRKAIMVRVLHGGVVNADSKNGNNEKRLVSTQKPIEVMIQIINAITKPDDIILEPFAGSGTTIIACEETGHSCIAFETEPEIVKIIIERWNDRYQTRGELWQG